MAVHHAVQDYLRQRGCAEHVVRGGLAGLLERWERVVDEVAAGYSLGLDDYLNDMDGRELIEAVLQLAAAREREEAVTRLAAADEKLQGLVAAAPGCLWGAAAAKEHGWTPERRWWYFTSPRRPGAQLERDLREVFSPPPSTSRRGVSS
jgi:hypothetical protein